MDGNDNQKSGGKKKKFKSEIKRKEDIFKQRNVKAKQQAYQKYRHHKNMKKKAFNKKK